MSIFKTFTAALPVAIFALLLSGCPESDNYSQGLVQIAQTQVCQEHGDEHHDEHDEDDHDEDEEDHEHDEGEEEGIHCEDEHEHEDENEGHHDEEHEHEDEHSEVKIIEDAEGHSVELISAYLVIDQIELLKCTNAATWFKRSVDGLLGTAWAQGGHDHGHGGSGNDVPDNQRNLNRPHIIDLMSADEALLALGNLRVEQGNYCGLRVSLVPAQDDAFGLPEDLSLIGTGFYLHWHQDIDGEESAMTVDSTGTGLPMTVSLDFPEALNVGADQHHVVVGVNYAEIFEDIDLSTVTAGALPALLLEGIEHALHIHDVGDGAAVIIQFDNDGDRGGHDGHNH